MFNSAFSLYCSQSHTLFFMILGFVVFYSSLIRKRFFFYCWITTYWSCNNKVLITVQQKQRNQPTTVLESKVFHCGIYSAYDGSSYQ